MDLTARRTMTCLCGWCGAVRQLDGTWDDRCEHVQAGPITHGICPDCAAAFRAGVEFDARPAPRLTVATFETRPSA